MTEQTINGIPFPMKELCDFSFLQAYGSVFQVFAQNDSGNISFGVSQGERRFFLKVAGAPPAYSCLSPAQAVENLQSKRRCMVVTPVPAAGPPKPHPPGGALPRGGAVRGGLPVGGGGLPV